jgi:hypothetical protein
MQVSIKFLNRVNQGNQVNRGSDSFQRNYSTKKQLRKK